MKQRRKSCLGYWRKARGLTQEQLSRHVRVNYRTISNWECDLTSPTKEQAETLSRVLGVSVRVLFPHELF